MDIIKAIMEAGVVGAGGAGFPSHVKLNTTVETFIVNGIECEPLLETDKYLMRTYTKELIEIILILKDHLKAKRAVIGIKDKNVKEIKLLSTMIKDMQADIELKIIGNYYPAGDEHILVQEVCGKSIPPSGIPLDVGAVVSNVATLIDIKRSLDATPVTSRVITVTGSVLHPTLIEVPIGTSIEECLNQAGGPSIANYTILMGGPFMGSECTKESSPTTYVTKTLGGLVVVADDSYLIRMKRLPINHIIRRAESACIQCQMCTDLCPRFLNGHPLYPHKVMKAVGMGHRNIEGLKSALICCECGICELYACPMGLSPKTMNHFIKKELMSQGIRYEKPLDYNNEPLDMMPYRKIHTKRLMARTGLTMYANIKLKDILYYTPKTVHVKLKQHIGAPAIPSVSTGMVVKKGDVIGTIKEGALGAMIHASISGIVKVESDAIIIAVIDQEVSHD